MKTTELTTTNELKQFSLNVDELITTLQTAKKSFEQLKKNKSQVISELTEVIKRLQIDKKSGLKLVVFGGFCAGKSSLINALLGIDHLEVGVQVTTATLTVIKQAQDNETAKVYYKTANILAWELLEQIKYDHNAVSNITSNKQQKDFKRFEELFTSIIEKYPEQGKNIENNDFLNTILPSLNDYIQYQVSPELISPEDRSDWSNRRDYLKHIQNIPENVLSYLGTQRNINFIELKDILHVDAEVHALTIEKVDLCIKSDYLAGDIQIIDTPGLGSLFERHTRLSESYVKYSDVVLYVLPAKGFGKNDVQFISLLQRRNKVLNENKAFFVSNMVDENIDDEIKYGDQNLVIEAINKHTEIIKDQLRKRGILESRVFSVSAECAKWSLKAEKDELKGRAQWRKYERYALWFDENETANPKINKELSGIPELTDSLKKYLNTNQISIKKEQIYKRVSAVLNNGLEYTTQRRISLDMKEVDLLRQQKKLAELKANISEGYNSEKEKTTIFLSGYIKENATVKLKENLELFLSDLQQEVVKGWMIEVDEGTFWDSIAHPFVNGRNWIAGLFKKDTLKSSLQSRTEKVVKNAVDFAMNKNNMREYIEKIHNDISTVITEEIRSSLKRIDDRLGEFRQRNQSGRDCKLISSTSNLEYSSVVVDDAMADIGGELLSFFGIGVGAGVGAGGVAYIFDAAVSGGMLTLIGTITSGLVLLFRNRDNVKEKYEKELSIRIKKIEPKLFASMIDEPFNKYEKKVKEKYSSEVEMRLNKVKDELVQAEMDLSINQTERQEVESELKQSDDILYHCNDRLNHLIKLLPKQEEI